MSKKSIGISGERELIHKFWSYGWAAVRVAGSGSIKYPTPDLVVGKNERKLAIECKITRKNSKYLTKEEISQLKEFSDIFGAEPWISIKFRGEGWFFVNIENLKEKNKSFMISKELIIKKGLRIEELIK